MNSVASVETGRSAPAPLSFDKNTRACIDCKLIKTFDQVRSLWLFYFAYLQVKSRISSSLTKAVIIVSIYNFKMRESAFQNSQPRDTQGKLYQ